MGDSRANDYFSFMSDKSQSKGKLHLVGQTPPAKKIVKTVILGDTIDFVEEPQIEVIETTASDTIIEKLFNLQRRFGTG
jgi:hypothetical protein